MARSYMATLTGALNDALNNKTLQYIYKNMYNNIKQYCFSIIECLVIIHL